MKFVDLSFVTEKTKTAENESHDRHEPFENPERKRSQRQVKTRKNNLRNSAPCM